MVNTREEVGRRKLDVRVRKSLDLETLETLAFLLLAGRSQFRKIASLFCAQQPIDISP